MKRTDPKLLSKICLRLSQEFPPLIEHSDDPSEFIGENLIALIGCEEEKYYILEIVKSMIDDVRVRNLYGKPGIIFMVRYGRG